MFKYLTGLLDPFRRDDAVLAPGKALPFILHHMQPLRWIILGALASTILAALIEVWLIYYVGHLVDRLIGISPDQLWPLMGGELILAALVLLLLRPLVALANEGLDDIVFRPTAVSLIRWRAHQHIMKQPVGWFRQQQSGQLAQRVREIGVSATGVVYAAIHGVAYVVTYFVGTFWLFTAIDMRLAIPLLIWAIFYGMHMAYAVPRFRNQYERFESAKSDLTGLLVDNYSNIETVKLYRDPRQDDQHALQKFKEAFTAFVGVQRFEVLINVGMVVLSNFLLVGLIGYAIYLWYVGAAQLGVIAASLALATRISGMAEWMMDGVASIYGNIGATREALRAVRQELVLQDAEDACGFSFKGGAIEFRNVTQHYGQDAGGLERLNLTIKAGEKVALVGPSGAGKSTLVNLLLRHFQPEDGQILVDGQDIATVNQQSLRQQFAHVAQDSSLLNRSIFDNIALGQIDASLTQVKSAAQKAHADKFIAQVCDPLGNQAYSALVGERGVRLSGGQKQRIALARALLRDAPILILDEATSALDTEIEADILETLYTFMADKTVIAIAHRLSTIARMDKIAFVENGKVVEFGCHDELLALDGRYAQLWKTQSGGKLTD